MHTPCLRLIYFKCNYSKPLLSFITFCTPLVGKTTVCKIVSSVRFRGWLIPGPPGPGLHWSIKQSVLLLHRRYAIKNCPPQGYWDSAMTTEAFTMPDICIHDYRHESKGQNSPSTRHWHQTWAGGTGLPSSSRASWFSPPFQDCRHPLSRGPAQAAMGPSKDQCLAKGGENSLCFTTAAAGEWADSK